MQQLREEVLIRKGLCYFLLPAFLAGVIAIFFPYFFAFLPVHMGNICICSYFNNLACGSPHYLIMKSKESFYVLQAINLVAVYIINFAFFVILLFMIYKIRHINDETLVGRECSYVIGLWMFTSITNFAAFEVDAFGSCH